MRPVPAGTVISPGTGRDKIIYYFGEISLRGRSFFGYKKRLPGAGEPFLIVKKRPPLREISLK